MKKQKLDDFNTELSALFAGCEDFVCRRSGQTAVYFIKNICDRKYVAESVIMPLLTRLNADFRGDFCALLQSSSVGDVADASAAASALVAGNAVVAVETEALYLASVSADSFTTRSVQEPDSDVTVRGPRAGFTESGENNLAALRRIIKSPRLKVEKYTVGSLTSTAVFVVYLDGVADVSVVNQIKSKLKDAKARSVVDSANIELLFHKGSNRLLPTVGSSEKVDKVASKLVSGRVAVICDGSPFVLTAPYVFIEGIQSAEDYLKNGFYSSFMRVLRFLAFLASLLAPALFTAAVYHDSFLLPSVLMDALREMEKDIKLPFVGEMLLMLTAFEIIREVGIRMPRTVGDAVGLVASLLVGDATVEAGLAGTSVLLIVAFSEVSGFIVPAFAPALTLLRYVYLLAAYLAGMYGILFVLVITAVVLVRKKSFGVGYMTPLYPFGAEGMKDFLISLPQKTLNRKEKLK